MDQLTRDKTLVKQLLKGDQHAFRCFVGTFGPRVYRFALSRLWNDEKLAEEATQACLSRACEKLATFKGEAALFTWLCTFCRREISALLKRNSRTNLEVSWDDDDADLRAAIDSLTAASRDEPDDRLSQEELSQFVRFVKDHLPEPYGEILDLKYIYGHSVDEIARLIGRSPKATESLLTRARVAFKEQFSLLIELKLKSPGWQDLHNE